MSALSEVRPGNEYERGCNTNCYELDMTNMVGYSKDGKNPRFKMGFT